MSDLNVVAGTCYAFFAYDVGLSIDLDEAERRIHTSKQRATLRHKRRTPRYFEYRPAPLRVLQEGVPVALGKHHTAPHVDAVLYDFGAVSVTYSISVAGGLDDLLTLSEELYDCAPLLDDSRRRVDDLLGAFGAAVQRPRVADFVETYSVFDLGALSPPCPPAELLGAHAHRIAQVLRSERQPLSSDETADALMNHISYRPGDVAIIDWDVTLLLGGEMEDVRAVLEFANVELLEMRSLDQQLDDALDAAYDTMARRRWRRLGPASSRAERRRIAQMQVDGAILFEGVNNALKLLGDQYLARLYRQVSQRFHLAEWDASILRKLDTLESIYQKLSDENANRRMEILEWIIIVLIAASIVLPFLPGFSAVGH
jgi:hypothetical protein